MSVTQVLLGLVAAVALAAPLARADMGASPAMDEPMANNGTSIARCRIVISSSVREETALAASEVANTTANFVCSQAELGNLTVEEAAAGVAESVSVVAARAIARLNVNCFLTGMGRVSLGGMSLAQAEAIDLASEFAANITEIKVCTDCNETASIVAANFSDIFVPAVANATIKLELATTEENQVIAVEEFVEAVTEVFVVNFTQVLVSSRTGAAEEGCEAPAAVGNATAPRGNATAPVRTPPPPPRPSTGPMASNTMRIECDESEPVEDFGKCAGQDIDVPKSCVSPDFLCVTKGPNFAGCRKDGIPKDDTWEGIVFECV